MQAILSRFFHKRIASWDPADSWAAGREYSEIMLRLITFLAQEHGVTEKR
jgi:hypothetical protein